MRTEKNYKYFLYKYFVEKIIISTNKSKLIEKQIIALMKSQNLNSFLES